MPLDPLFTAATPIISRRGVHLDLKGLPPTAERLLSLLDLFAAARYNVVQVEWEDTFPWTVDERFRSPTAYTPDEVRAFCAKAKSLGIELIPNIQCLGHMETPLSVDGYEHLREISDFEAGLNPLAPGARELIQSMVDDVLTLMPDVRHFHLGGDEARTFGKNPETEAYVKKHGKGALYLYHVEPILDSLASRNIRPILWHDMMIDWDSDALKALAAKSDLMVWAYGGDPAAAGDHCNLEMVKRFADHGLTLWGGAAYKGAEGYDVDVPDLSVHIENTEGWAKLAQEVELTGVVATAWSRYAVDTIQCNPIDSSLDSMLAVAVILHDGTLPDGGVDACIEAMAEVGEKERFVACRKTMSSLAELRKSGWESVQHARQMLVLAKNDPRRTSARNPKLGLHPLPTLGTVVEKLLSTADEARTAFAGLIPSMWIEEYLSTRIQPLSDELSELNQKFKNL